MRKLGFPPALAAAAVLGLCAAPAQAQPAPMDLLGVGLVDANGILRNPRWGLQ